MPEEEGKKPIMPPEEEEGKPMVPKPMVFAIMRNAHEVIRGAMEEVKILVESDDFDADPEAFGKAKELWTSLYRWGDMHMKMEEGSEDKTRGPIGMFRLLENETNGSVDQRKLLRHHKHLYEYEEDVVDAFDTNNPASVRMSYPSFYKENTKHLKVEEQIMMPKIQEMAQQGKPMKRFMREEMLPLVRGENFEWFVRFGTRMLDRHSHGKPKVRVWFHALWALSETPEEWQLWDSWLKEEVRPETYQETQQAIEAWKDFNRNNNGPGGLGANNNKNEIAGGETKTPDPADNTMPVVPTTSKTKPQIDSDPPEAPAAPAEVSSCCIIL